MVGFRYVSLVTEADLTADSFAPHEGTTFTLLTEDGTAPLVLTEVVRELGVAQAAPAAREPFSLWFTSPTDVALPQGTYAMDHEGLGRLDLFLVPRQPAPGGPPRYEAMFS